MPPLAAGLSATGGSRRPPVGAEGTRDRPTEPVGICPPQRDAASRALRGGSQKCATSGRRDRGLWQAGRSPTLSGLGEVLSGCGGGAERRPAARNRDHASSASGITQEQSPALCAYPSLSPR